MEQDFSHLQDVMGTLIMVKRYIVLCLIFSLDESDSVSQVETFLHDALARLTTAFPFLAGQIVYKGRDESKGKSGLPSVIHLASAIELVTKDLRNDPGFPTLSTMSSAKYPFSMLDPAVVAPQIATSYASDNFDQIAPYLILQANFIRGGLILTVSGNHTQMDMTGMGIIISQFSKACRDQPFTSEELRQGNQPRGNAIPLLDESYQPGPELHDVVVKPSNINMADILATDPQWAYFNFTASSLAELKSEASKQKLVPYITTDDAVASLCWQRLTAVRASSLGPGQTTTFARPLSVRKWFGLEGYTGQMVDVVYDTLEAAHERSLGELAGRLRGIVQENDKIIYHARAFATALSRLDDRSKLSNGAHLNAQRDLVISSYANIKCCDLEFGSKLGRPLAARRPRMPVWPGLAYLMPKDQNGEIAVAFCVGTEELEQLKRDETLIKWASFVG